MATTTATFQPGFATAGNSASSSTALATSNGNQVTTSGASSPNFEGQNSNSSGPLASVQQLLQQPGIKKAMPLLLLRTVRAKKLK